jgi:hypothetical protein
LPTPAWLVWGAAVATGLLFACERWRWFPVHYEKGWPVLLAVAVVAAVLIVILAWMLVGLVFRRRVQFGLRTLLVFVTLCAVVCSWLTDRVEERRQQAKAVIAIYERSGGSVSYDWELDGNGSDLPKPLSPAPKQLMNLLGVDFFSEVYRLELLSPATDMALNDVPMLSQVKYLVLEGDQITDSGLRRLQGLVKLRELDLVNTEVTDEGVKNLQRALPNCKIDDYHGTIHF